MSQDAALNFSAQSHSLVSVRGIPGYWATKTGGEVSAAVTMVWDGGANSPEPLAGSAVTGNVILTRPYRVAVAVPILKRYRPLTGAWETTLTDQPTDALKVPLGDADIYPGALLVRVAGVDIDVKSGEPKNLEMEFAVPRII